MPNWCNTAYTLIGEEKELKSLHKIMHGLETRKQPSVPNGFGTSWLGCLVNKLGGNYNQVYCRGEWSELDYSKGCSITFNTMTAWSPCNEVWDFVKQKFPSIEYYYKAEESGMALYQTNDADGTFYPERFLVELCTLDNRYYSEYFISLPGACHYIKEMTGEDVETIADIEELNDRMNEKDEDAYCYINEYKVVA